MFFKECFWLLLGGPFSSLAMNRPKAISQSTMRKGNCFDYAFSKLSFVDVGGNGQQYYYCEIYCISSLATQSSLRVNIPETGYQ